MVIRSAHENENGERDSGSGPTPGEDGKEVRERGNQNHRADGKTSKEDLQRHWRRCCITDRERERNDIGMLRQGPSPEDQGHLSGACDASDLPSFTPERDECRQAADADRNLKK